MINCRYSLKTGVYQMTREQKKPIIKRKRIVKKNKLNQVGFVAFNTIDYRLFLYLCSKIINNDGSRELEANEIQREYTIHASELLEHFDITLDMAYIMLKRGGKKLADSSISLEKPDLFETWNIPITSLTTYNHKAGSLTIELNANIMPYFIKKGGQFTQYTLANIAPFSSIYTIRLFEIMMQFRFTGEIYKSIKELREMFATGVKYSLYKDFKKRVLTTSIDEINKYYPDYKLTLEENKNGRGVDNVAFKFKADQKKHVGYSRFGNPVNAYKTKRQRTEEEIQTEQQDLEL